MGFIATAAILFVSTIAVITAYELALTQIKEGIDELLENN